MAIPTLSPEQLEAARAAATEARRKRAELKDDVRTGKISFVEALDKCGNDDILAHIRVVDLLKSIPRIGETRAAELMEKHQIAPNRRVRGLGRHQITRLKEEFR